MIRFELVTLSGVKSRSEVYEVVLPTPQGYIAVFPEHAPLVSIAQTGVISVRLKQGDADERMKHYAVNGGVIEIANNTVRVLVDEADDEVDIVEAEVQKALAEAKELAKNARDSISLAQAQALVDRQSTRLRVAELRRRKQSTMR